MSATPSAYRPDSATPGLAGSPTRGSDFAPLLHLVRARGLLQPRRRRYAVLVAVDVLAFAGVWATVFLLRETWWALVLAVPAALFATRIMFIGHDVGHRQVARTAKVNRVLALLAGDLISGLGSRWWTDKHNRHHANPNHADRDPDVGPGALVWTPEQAAARRGGPGAWMARRQGRLFFPLLLLEAFHLKISSLRAARRAPDLLLLCTHAIIYLGGLMLMLGPAKAAVFVLAHHGLVGLHLGTAFAPNHKGMPMAEPGVRHGFLRKQVLTSRNVTGGRAVDWLLGGLNYQIEHHLFPGMPRPNLRRAQPLVQAHCAALGLSYAQASLPASLGVTIRHLDSAGVTQPGDCRPGD